MPGSAAADGVELPVRPGDVLDGRFRIDSVLGVGGMGIVFAATHLQLAQRVAIKVILPSGSKEEVPRLQRLLNEARIIAQMKTPHVPHVLDVGTLDSGKPYLVMELLEGVDLDRHLAEHGALSVDDAVDFVLQVCEAVAEAHSLGVIHRDLKPSNLFLTKGVDKRPLVKVLDFGLAKFVREESTHSAASVTRPLEIIGTPSYMSPEQLRSTHDVDERTDIWSLGVILYELVAGRVPFDSPSIPDLCAAIVRDVPPPIRVALPDGLEAVIQKCLQKYPKDRFPRITELAQALAPFNGDAQRIERVTRVQTQDTTTLGRPLTGEAINLPMSPRARDIATRIVSRRADGTIHAVDGDEDALGLLRPGLFGMRRLGIPLIVLFVAATGGGTALLAVRLMDKGDPTRAAATATATAAAFAPTTPERAEPVPPPALELPTTPSKPHAATPAPASQRPARPGTKPGIAPATPSAAPPTSASSVAPAPPVDPDKLFESR